jgi:hypothetical protein
MHISLFTSTYKANSEIKTEDSNLKGAKQNITDRINRHLYDFFRQCCGSVTFWNGSRSGPCSFRQWLLRCQQKISFLLITF